jgi:hypothetical protein
LGEGKGSSVAVVAEGQEGGVVARERREGKEVKSARFVVK